MAILNLTQHNATPDQRAAGVVDLPADARAELVRLLTFAELPDGDDIMRRARAVAELAALNASGEDREDVDGFADQAMIGGALWLMAPLAFALRMHGITPVFAFSVRDTEERAQPDGTVAKTTVFRHAGFVVGVAI